MPAFLFAGPERQEKMPTQGYRDREKQEETDREGQRRDSEGSSTEEEETTRVP